MARFTTVTDVELARARSDSSYRQRLLSESLERLIEEINRRKRQKAAADPIISGQLREGALLAVKLADLIARLDQKRRK